MRLHLLRLLTAVSCLVHFSVSLKAQSCIPTNINGAVINLNCNQACSTLVFPVPHIKSSDDYTLTTVPYAPYPYVTPTGTQDPVLYADDQYSFLVNLPFTFCFYGTTYPSTVVGSNGIMTFDPANASCANAWPITQLIPFAGGTICSSGSTYYPKASIMGAYSDLDPRTVASPTDRVIQWDVFGTAPCRKFVVSYYHIGVFGVPTGSCPSPSNTFQMVIHESTGIVEIFTEQRACASTTNAGRGILGIQNWNRDAAIAAPGKNNTFWTETNTGYRFIPSAGTSRYVSSQLFTITNTFVMNGDTATTTPGILDIRFPNACFPPGSNQYIVRTTFSACDNPANLLISNDTITVNRTNNLNATSATTNTGCGAPSGTITITVPAGVGTPPYTYVLDGGTPVTAPSPYTFTNVGQGPHTVVVTDASAGCTSTINITVNQTGTINATTNANATACAGVNNGSITVSSANGTSPYSFVLDGGAPVNGTLPYTFTNLSSGAHTLVITDNSGCVSNTININVPAGAGVLANGSSSATTCAGVNNGTVTANATAGVAPFTYSLDGGPAQSGANPYTFTNVSAGAHTVLITDNLGCTGTINVNVAVGPGISGNATTTAASCATATNGTITATANTGTAPYTYSLDGGTPQSGGNPYTFNNVSAGAHTVVITDNLGCTGTINMNVAAGPGISGILTQSATSCPGANDGAVTANATTGTAPFTYSLDGGPAQSGGNPYTFLGVAAGAHTVLITDNFGCTITLNVNVAAGPTFVANATSGATSCSGANDGTITVTPTNGIAPFTFSLDGGPFVPGGVPYTFLNVPAGNHTVLVTDAATCVTNSISVDVASGPALTTTVTASDALCNGGATGSITITQPTIGTAPYQYSLDGVIWQASNVFNGLAAGNYTVYYSESNGCQGSQNVVVSEPAAMSSSAATVPVVCNGQSNGIITITAGGGITPYQYSIDGGVTWQASNVFNVVAGNYNIIIRDGNNCTKTQSATITEPAVLTATSANSNASCNGGNDGLITVNAAGGNAGYSYSIDGGVTWQTSNVFNVAPGNYTVNVKDNLGCTTSFNTTVGLTNNLTLTPQTDPTICEGTSTQLQLASNAIVYAWSPATGLSSTTIPNPIANPVVTTQYIVIATLGRCSADDTVIVNVNAAPIPNAGPDGNICYGQSYTLQGSGGTQYLWTPSTYLSNPNIPNPVSTPAKTITYTLSEVRDAIGCKSLVTDDVTVDVTPPIKVNTFPFDTVAYAGDQFQLNATSIANIYTWTPATGLSNPNIPDPVVTVGPIGADVVYQVIASTIAGCKGEGYVRIKVYTGPDIYVPTGFTPNGDGKNDKLTPFPVGITSIKYFRVFNRWGQLIFSTNTLHEGWDGKLGGFEQPSGVYVWMVEGMTKNNRVIKKKGTVTLIR